MDECINVMLMYDCLQYCEHIYMYSRFIEPPGPTSEYEYICLSHFTGTMMLHASSRYVIDLAAIAPAIIPAVNPISELLDPP